MRLRVNIWILEWRLFQISFFYLIRRFKFFEKIILVSILRFVSLSRKRGDEYETQFWKRDDCIHFEWETKAEKGGDEQGGKHIVSSVNARSPL